MLGSSLLLRFWDWHAISWSLGIAGMVIFALGCTVATSREADAPRADWLVRRIVSRRRFSRAGIE